MTDLLARPVRAVLPAPDRPGRSLAVSGALAGVGAAVSGLLVAVALAVIGWFTADTGSFGGAVEVGLVGWLFANGAGLVLPSAVVTVVPWGGVLLCGLGAYAGARWACRQGSVESWRDVTMVVSGLAGGYVAVAAVAHLATRSSAGHAIGWRVVVVPLVVTALAATAAALRTTDLLRAPWERLPDDARATAAGAVAVASTLVASSAAVLSVSLVLDFGRALDLAEGMGAGTFGGLVVALLGIALVPNAALLTTSYVAGPGFALGTGTTVSPADVALGPVPGHPLLAALPSGAGAWWQFALVCVPLAAGAVGGLVAVRRAAVQGYDRMAMVGGSAGLAGGVVVGLSTALAGGAVGPGRMADVGPDLLPVVAALAVGCLLGGVVGAVAAGWWRRAVDPVDGAPPGERAYETAGAPGDPDDEDDAEPTVPVPSARDSLS